MHVNTSPIHVPPIQHVLKHCGAHINNYTAKYKENKLHNQV